ncbi:Uncharacterized protein SCF082_LOCUS37094 [Durusdinium trenchii]|uniref:Uncharacterized protein n=1 Tax=Durusdinium trenchii TaxID=1381693 RepID=A0ABP0PNX3_9DINO
MLRGSLSGSMTQSLSMTAVRPSIRASVTSGAGHPQPLRASTISSTTANAPSQRRNAMQWITSRISQGLFWILTLGHCSVYMFGPGSFEEFSNFVLFVWAPCWRRRSNEEKDPVRDSRVSAVLPNPCRTLVGWCKDAKDAGKDAYVE